MRLATVSGNMDRQATQAMAEDRRALLTKREREILRGEDDVTEKYYGVVVTRARNKIERLAADIEALECHDSLADELRAVVCEDQ